MPISFSRSRVVRQSFPATAFAHVPSEKSTISVEPKTHVVWLLKCLTRTFVLRHFRDPKTQQRINATIKRVTTTVLRENASVYVMDPPENLSGRDITKSKTKKCIKKLYCLQTTKYVKINCFFFCYLIKTKVFTVVLVQTL